MTLGLSIAGFTLLHVVISLIALLAGAVVLAGLLGGRLLANWNQVFLVTTAATSITGFMFPATALLPSHVFASSRCWHWRRPWPPSPRAGAAPMW